jgi:hypothetical protein
LAKLRPFDGFEKENDFRLSSSNIRGRIKMIPNKFRDNFLEIPADIVERIDPIFTENLS